MALWIAAGATPKEVAERAGHTSVTFTLDRYGHLFPEADTTLRDRLEACMRPRGLAGGSSSRSRSRPAAGAHNERSCS